MVFVVVFVVVWKIVLGFDFVCIGFDKGNSFGFVVVVVDEMEVVESVEDLVVVVVEMEMVKIVVVVVGDIEDDEYVWIVVGELLVVVFKMD